MKRLWVGVSAAASWFLLAGGPASAVPIFTLSGVTLVGGGTLAGSFTTNNGITSVSDFDITASANGSFPGFEYKLVNSAVTAQNLPQFFQLDSLVSGNELRLLFTPNLTLSGSNVSSTFSYEFELDGGQRFIGSGSVNVAAAAAVPEPSTIALFGFGLLALGVLGWRLKANALAP
jgi:hypothetical protein